MGSGGSSGAGPTGSALAVIAGGQRHSIESGAIAEVVRPPPITRVPLAPPALLGLISLRGRVLPVIDLGLLLDPACQAGSRSRLVVLARPEAMAIAVDAVGALREDAHVNTAPLPLAALLAKAFGAAGVARAGMPAAPRPAMIGLVPASSAPEEELRPILRFRVAGQAFGLSLDLVREVCDAPAGMLQAGGRDAAVQGVMEHRGRLLTVVRPDVLLGLRAPPRSSGRVVVLRQAGASLGLLVEQVEATERLPAANIVRAPALLNRAAGEARIEAVARSDRGLVALLAPTQLFRDAGLVTTPDASSEEDAAMAAKAAPERVLLFRLGAERYALPVGAVREVIRHPDVLARVPRAPAFLAGLASHRGAVLPVIDQRARFGVREAGPVAGRRVIVTQLGDIAVGFAVDAVEALCDLDPEALSDTPAIATGDGRLFDRVARLAGDGRPVLLVNPQEMLDRAERDLLAEVAAGAVMEPA